AQSFASPRTAQRSPRQMGERLRRRYADRGWESRWPSRGPRSRWGVRGMSIRHNARTCAAGSPIWDGWETRKKEPLVNKRLLSCVSGCSADDEVDLLLDRIVRAVQCRDGGVHAGLREATPGFVDFHGVAGTECLVPDTLREHAPVGPLPDFSAKGI